MTRFQLHPRFITDPDGRRTEAVLDIAEFERVLEGLKDRLVVVETEPDECADLLHAAGTALDFWDNLEDAAAWNDYPPM